MEHFIIEFNDIKFILSQIKSDAFIVVVDNINIGTVNGITLNDLKSSSNKELEVFGKILNKWYLEWKIKIKN